MMRSRERRRARIVTSGEPNRRAGPEAGYLLLAIAGRRRRFIGIDHVARDRRDVRDRLIEGGLVGL